MKHKDWVKNFKALGNEKRLKILGLLWPAKELPVAEIAEKIQLSVKATSKHLSILRNVGFIEGEGKKGSVYYSINPDFTGEVRRILERIL